jgi:phosphonate transport system ATP-binding protein
MVIGNWRSANYQLPSHTSPVLKVINLTKVYDDGTVALRDVSFEVVDGEFLTIIGLSGSGKSTLLRCINRLIEPTAGEIWWNDTRLSHVTGEELRRARRKIGMIFQHFNLVDRSTVLTNVLSGRLGYVNPIASIFGRFPKEDLQRAYASLERVGISGKATNRADELSGGQRQRVGIARALMQEPELMLADEPVASLDPALAHSIMRYLQQINREDGITVVCSLHFLDLVQQYGTRAIALNEGRVVFDGSPSSINDERFKEIYGQEAERIG